MCATNWQSAWIFNDSARSSQLRDAHHSALHVHFDDPIVQLSYVYYCSLRGTEEFRKCH